MKVKNEKKKKILVVTLDNDDMYVYTKKLFSSMKKEVTKVPVQDYSLIVDLSNLLAFEPSEQLTTELWFELCMSFGFYNVYIVNPKSVVAKMQLIEFANRCNFTGTFITEKEEITENDFMSVENKEDKKILVVTLDSHAMYEFTRELVSLVKQEVAKIPVQDYSLIVDSTNLLAVKPLKQHTLEAWYSLCMSFGFNNLYMVNPKSEITKLQLLRIAKKCDFTGTFIKQEENTRLQA